MNEINPYPLTALSEQDIPAMLALWRRAHPLHPMNDTLLKERVFSPPDAEGELMLAARDGQGKLLGWTAGIFPCMKPELGGVRWLSVEPELWDSGLPERLLEELARRFKARGAERLRFLGTAPFYLRPGVDTRETGLIVWLLGRGWTHEQTVFNLTVDLERWAAPTREEIFAPDAQGYYVRRARAEDREAFQAYALAHWTRNWMLEASQGIAHEPASLFLGMKDEQIVGFSTYEVSQCLNAFGPTGVTPEHRQSGLGRRLLWACLADLKAAGRPVCEIGWVGPVPFYHRAAGAMIGPVYWMLSREV